MCLVLERSRTQSVFTHRNSMGREGNPLSFPLSLPLLLPLTDHTSADLWPGPAVKDCCLSKHTSQRQPSEGEKREKRKRKGSRRWTYKGTEPGSRCLGSLSEQLLARACSFLPLTGSFFMHEATRAYKSSLKMTHGAFHLSHRAADCALWTVHCKVILFSLLYPAFCALCSGPRSSGRASE